MFKYLTVPLGPDGYLLVKEYTQISGVINVSVFALIRPVGDSSQCVDFVVARLVAEIRKEARKARLDTSRDFFATLGTVLVAAFDNLDTAFMNACL